MEMRKLTIYKRILCSAFLAFLVFSATRITTAYADESVEMTAAEKEADRLEKIKGLELLVKHGKQILSYKTIGDVEIQTEISNYISSISAKNLKKETYENVVLIHETLTNYLESVAYTDNYVIKVFVTTEKNNGITLEKMQGYQSAAITVINKDGIAIKTDDLAQIKARGNNTSNFAKRPYTIKFDKKTELIPGAGKEKKWTLLAEVNDKTLLRNALMLDLAKTMEMPYTSEHDFAKVWVDGEYRGIYLLTEPVEVKEHRVDIDLSKGDFLLDLNAFREERGKKYITPLAKEGLRFEIVEPDELTNEEYRAIANKMTELYSVIKDNINTPDGYEKVKECIDVESFAKLYMLEEFSKNCDINKFSIFVYYKDGKLHGGPAWDFDQSLGNVHRDSAPVYWKKIDGVWTAWTGIYGTGPAFKYLKKYDEFNSLVKKYFVEYTPAIENIIYGEETDYGSIAYYRALYGDAFATNYRSKAKGGAGWDIWVTSWRAYKALSTYDESIEYLKYFIENRYAWLYDAWNIQEVVMYNSAIPGSDVEITPTLTETPTPTLTPTPTSTPTPTLTPAPTVTPTTGVTPTLMPKLGNGQNPGSKQGKNKIIVVWVAIALAFVYTVIVSVTKVKKSEKEME